MATDPSTTNSTATAVDTAINDAVQAAEQAVDVAAETALQASSPIFSLPIIKQVADFVIEDIVSTLGSDVSVSLQKVGTFVVIDTQVSNEEGGISTALANLMIAEKSGDPKQIQAAIAAYEVAQSALVNDDGSATPIT